MKEAASANLHFCTSMELSVTLTFASANKVVEERRKQNSGKTEEEKIKLRGKLMTVKEKKTNVKRGNGEN